MSEKEFEKYCLELIEEFNLNWELEEFKELLSVMLPVIAMLEKFGKIVEIPGVFEKIKDDDILYS